MDYQYFSTKIGSKFDIVDGSLAESDNGLLTVSENYGNYVIYLNKFTKTYNLIVPRKAYIGRRYKLRKLDCVTLFAEWLDDHYDSNWGNIYNKLSNREFYKYYKNGMCLWYEDNNFLKVDTPQHGDCLVYEDKPHSISHVGIYLTGHKILHHLPEKLSSIDEVDDSKILGIYRYGK